MQSMGEIIRNQPRHDLPASLVEKGRFHFTMPDGTSLSFPIAGNWRLENATPEQLNNVEVDEDGLHWPDIDEDLSFAGLLCGDHGQFVKAKHG